MKRQRIDPHGGSLANFARPRGPDLLARTEPLWGWIVARATSGMWPYTRTLRSSPGPEAEFEDVTGAVSRGLNFATQDYLGLATDARVVAAVREAAERWGVHSPGSGALTGHSSISRELEAELGELVGKDHVLLFPTGWGAGFGLIVGLVRHYDHVVLDEVAHACLQQGAAAATTCVYRFRHLDTEDMIAKVAAVRADDASGGLLLVTEGLYSMDADAPDLRAAVDCARRYGATLVVDQAHDLVAHGPGGTGQVGEQGLLGEVDVVMGASSKSLASNGGFVAVSSPAVQAFISAYGGSFTSSSALSPLQVTAVRTALAIARSAEGDRRRAQLLAVSRALRDGLAERGYDCLGMPSAINPLLLRSETLARAASFELGRRGVVGNLVEFPAVRRGRPRFRLQAMATHTVEQARRAAAIVADTIDDVRQSLEGEEEKGA